MANARNNGDDVQRARLAKLLRDPSGYFADARRQAHEQARRLVDARLDAEGAPSPTRP